MHREIRDKLEDYLRGDDGSSSALPAEFHAHLGECLECASELALLKEQSQLLRSLESAPQLEPRAGFYARVLERIEEQPASIWTALLDPKFGFRLAVASALLVTLLGAYLVSSEPSGPELGSSAAVVSTDLPADIARAAETSLEPAAGGQTETARRSGEQPEDSPRERQQRDAVLVDLASFRQ